MYHLYQNNFMIRNIPNNNKFAFILI